MGMCNYCNLKRIKEKAKKNDKVITVTSKNDVYSHPDYLNTNRMSIDELEKYWVAWLMEIPSSCQC